MLTGDLARAGRAMTKVSVGTIARYAKLTKEQVRFFEQRTHGLTDEERQRLQAALEHYGALFLPEEGTLGYGVRRKYAREGLLRMNTWEGEGGTPPSSQ